VGIVAAIAAAAAAGAVAAVTPLAPRPGAVVNAGRPTFEWSLPPNEQSDAIFVASRPATTADGGFVERNLVFSSALAATDTSWRAPAPLRAGAYWWLVRSLERSTAAPRFSRPARFTIAAGLRVASISVATVPARKRVTIRIPWRTNTRRVGVEGRAYLGRRLVWWRRSTYAYPPLGRTQVTRFAWTSPVAAGSPLTLNVRVVAAPLRFAKTIRFVSP
jgi:hypothetical protein